MKIIVKARHMTLTDSLTAYAEEKLGHAITRVFDQPAARIDIELCDMGHVHDRSDKVCRVTVFMPKGKTIVICEADDNMYKAIDLAHDRLLLQVKRERDRKTKVTRVRKWAARDRALTARASLTVQPERWEEEVREYERSTARL